MQLTSLLASASLLWAATAAPAPADSSAASTSYSLLSTHSGNSDVHLRAIGYTKNGDVSIDGTNPLTVFFDGTKLGVTGAHGEHGAQIYLHVNDDNSIVINDAGTDGFSLPSTDLAFDGKQDFGVCVDDGKLYIESAPSCNDFVGIGVYTTKVEN